MATDVAFGEAMPLVDELERRVGDGVTTATVAAERRGWRRCATARWRPSPARRAGWLGDDRAVLTPLPRGAGPPRTWRAVRSHPGARRRAGAGRRSSG